MSLGDILEVFSKNLMRRNPSYGYVLPSQFATRNSQTIAHQSAAMNSNAGSSKTERHVPIGLKPIFL